MTSRRREIEPDDIPAELDRMCRQHSVLLEHAEIQKRAQGLVYRTEEEER
jgi:hypothetical protein